jgi:peroxiredoxin
MIRHAAVAVFAALLLPALAAAQAPTNAAPTPVAAAVTAQALAPGAVAPAFTLPDQAGKAVSLASFAGKVVVLEWTNYECPFVKHHAALGTMKGLAEKWAAKGVVWLAINSTKHATREQDAAWIAQNKFPYPILEDFDGAVGHAYGAVTTPHMFVVGKDGRLAYQGAIDDDRRIQGQATVNYVEQALTALTAGQPVATARTEPYGCSVKYRESGAPAGQR